MSETPKSSHAARSRAPINEAGVRWWNEYGSSDETTEKFVPEQRQDAGDTKAYEDKCTSTNTLDLHKQFVIKTNHKTNAKMNEKKIDNPKEIILRKWREELAKTRYEQARKAIINSLKEKFGEKEPIGNNVVIKRRGNDKRIPMIIVSEHEEEKSNVSF